MRVFLPKFGRFIGFKRVEYLGTLCVCLLLLFSSCSKEFINPYDLATPADVWMPRDLKLDTLGPNKVQLFWEQDNRHIDGYVVQKFTNGQSKEYLVFRDTIDFIDSNVVETNADSTCLEIRYEVLARAGRNRSLAVSIQTPIYMPLSSPFAYAGEDIVVTDTASSVQLNAQPGALGESGSWSIVSGLGGSFSNVNSPNSIFTGIAGQTFVLKWSLQAYCLKSHDEVMITFPLAHTCGANNVHNSPKIYGIMTDQQGNVYKTIVIGSQEWMAENLKTTIYRNGDAISNVTDGAQWIGLTTGAWCSYDNDSQYDCPYGNLYNWYAVADSRNLCPMGWHVPSDAEWTVLTNYLGGEALAGGKMKSLANFYWQSPNTAATNESGFSGLPGGYRNFNGTFIGKDNYAYWWSSTQSGSSSAWNRVLHFNYSSVSRYFNYSKPYGFSVRCLRD